MSESMMVRGFVATDPEQRTLENGLHVARFRLAQTPCRYDRTANAWVDGETNWFSVSCFRELALNVQTSVKKGHPVLVTGRLRVKHFTRQDGTPGVSVEIEAETVGHDLRFGTGTFGRSHREQAAPAPTDAPPEDAEGAQDAPVEPDVDGAADGRGGSVVTEAEGLEEGEVLDPGTGEVSRAA